MLAFRSTPASAAPVGEGVMMVVLGLEGEDAHDVAAQTLTNELRQVVVESSGHTLSLSNPALSLAASGVKCDLAPFGRRYGPSSDRGIDAGCQRSIAVRLGAQHMLWGHLYEEGGTLRAKVHYFREGKAERVETLAYDASAPKRVARRLYLKLAVPDGSGDVRLGSDGALAGSELWVDGKAEGPYASGLELTLSTGEHVLEARREGRALGRGNVVVAAGKVTEVRLVFVPRTVLDPSAGFHDPPSVLVMPAGGWKRTAGFVGLGVGAALIGAGLVSSLRVRSLDDDFASDGSLLRYRSGISEGLDACDVAKTDLPSVEAGASTPGRVERLCSALSTFRVAQYVFYGAGALAAGAGAYLLATSPGPRRTSATDLPRASAATWSLRPWAGPGAGGVWFGSSFLELRRTVMRRRNGQDVGAALSALVVSSVFAAGPSCDADTSAITCEEAASRGAPCGGRGGNAGTNQEGASGASGSPMGSGGIGGGGTGGAGTGGLGGTGGMACTAPTTDCGGTCVDVKGTDAENCGACGRACLGTATCAAGACVPEVMATGEVAPYALVDDGTSLYWVSPAIKGVVDSSKMRRVAKASAGGTATNVFDSTRVRARSLGFAQGKLYWGDLGANPSDTANQKLVAGTPGTGDCCTTVEPDQVGIEHLTLGGGRVYWLLGGGTGTLRGKLADGTGPVAPEVFGQINPRWTVVDTDAVPYWVANAGGGKREVRRLLVSPPNTAAPVANGTDLLAVELTPDRFYWADRAAGTVQSRPKASPTEAPRDEFGGQGPVEGFRVDGTTLYVLTAQGRQLKAWRKGPDDAAPLLLGEVEAKADPYGGNPFGATYVLTDAQYLYFADVGTVDTGQVVPESEGDGVVYRVAK